MHVDGGILSLVKRQKSVRSLLKHQENVPKAIWSCCKSENTSARYKSRSVSFCFCDCNLSIAVICIDGWQDYDLSWKVSTFDYFLIIDTTSIPSLRLALCNPKQIEFTNLYSKWGLLGQPIRSGIVQVIFLCKRAEKPSFLQAFCLQSFTLRRWLDWVLIWWLRFDAALHETSLP